MIGRRLKPMIFKYEYNSSYGGSSKLQSKKRKKNTSSEIKVATYIYLNLKTRDNKDLGSTINPTYSDP